MSTISATTTLLAQTLAWSLLHSLWQGLLLYVALYVLFKALPDLGSRIKYYLTLSAFSALFIWFAATWVSQYQQLNSIVAYSPTHIINYTIPIATAIPTLSTTVPAPSPLHYALISLNQCIPYIIVLYLLGLVVMMFRFSMNIIQLKALRTRGLTQPGAQLLTMIENWQAKLGIFRPVQLFISDRINVPMMLGSLKPIILLPIATINNLSTEQVEAILLHELAHIRRHDYLLNIFQTIVETILFFNPFVWLLSRIIRREREECCDELVVTHTTNPLPYATALAMLENNRTNPNQLSLAATGNKNQLLNRIKKIMTMKKKNPGYSQPAIIVAAIIAISLSIAVITITPSLAQKAKGNKSNKANAHAITTDNKSTTDSAQKRADIEHKSKTLTPVKSIPTDAEDARINDSIAEQEQFLAALSLPDSSQFEFTTRDGTIVSGMLFDNPLKLNRIFKGTHTTVTRYNIDLEDLRNEMYKALTHAYRNINSPKLDILINKTIDNFIADKNVSFNTDAQNKLAIEQHKQAIHDNEQALKDYKKALIDNQKALKDNKQALIDHQQAIKDRELALKNHKKALEENRYALEERNRIKAKTELDEQQHKKTIDDLKKVARLMEKDGLLDYKNFKIRKTIDGEL